MSTDLVHWESIAADGFAFPDDVSASRLGDELSAMLVSPDPEVRDEHAYTAAARWIREGHLDDVLEDLGNTAADRFTHPEIQARTFAPLVLRCVLTRGHAVPGTLPEAAAERWYAGFSAWYPSERDTRGWDESLGWLHAVAHGADAASAFAEALPGRRTQLLELCARRMTAPHTDYRYEQLEDARLARALSLILLAPDLSAEQATGWLSVVADALDGGGPGPVPPWAFNTFATLQALHLHLTRGLADGGVPPHAPIVAERVAAILRLPYSWLA
ncbi:uncharacterized protein DUF2785 [Streptomyces sp. SLBN-118]|uniref:DUF2785 domain-containing protein n=1 Tax=Streptomyces sp. SLBN-118 TaxID=2768454 RepID=UPI0011544787|nr:DUF2785 domain-containing protein [Streptomyces sp. SLBN-118]TQK42712.1 uncharacterized protein DUF2785 [Streptomyces sp. SLBN-118]